MASGFLTSLRIGEESVYGTPAGNMVQFPIVRPGLKASQNLLASKALLNDVNPRKPVSGNRMVDGDIETEVSADSIGWALKWMTGAVATTAAGAGTAYVTTAGYAIGISVIALGTGSGTIPAGSYVSIGGILYRVNASTGGGTVTSITIDGGLVAAVLSGAAVTVSALVGHKFNLTTVAMKSLFAEVGFLSASAGVDVFHKFDGLYMGKGAIRFEQEGVCAWTFSTMGRDFTSSATTMNTGTVITPTHVPFAYFGGRIYQNDALLGYVKAMNIDFDRSLDGNQFVINGTGTRYEIPGGIAQISGTIKALFPTAALNDLANAGTTVSLRGVLRDSLGQYCGVFMPEVRLELSTPEVTSEAVVEQTVPFKAFYSTNTDATAIQFTTASTRASYATVA